MLCPSHALASLLILRCPVSASGPLHLLFLLLDNFVPNAHTTHSIASLGVCLPVTSLKPILTTLLKTCPWHSLYPAPSMVFLPQYFHHTIYSVYVMGLFSPSPVRMLDQWEGIFCLLLCFLEHSGVWTAREILNQINEIKYRRFFLAWKFRGIEKSCHIFLHPRLSFSSQLTFAAYFLKPEVSWKWHDQGPHPIFSLQCSF